MTSGLRPEIGPRRPLVARNLPDVAEHPQHRRAPLRLGQHRHEQHDQRRREGAVHAPAPRPVLAEEVIPEHDEHGREDHRLLGAHAERARDRRAPRPPADRAVQRQQQEQAAEALAALNDVGDGAGRQRVHDPDERDGERQRRRGVAEPRAQTIRRQRPADDAEEREPGRQVDQQVQRVIAGDVEPAKRMVEGEREVEDGTARRPRSRRRVQPLRRPERADARIVRDAREIVEDEGSAEAVRVGEDAGRDEIDGQQRDERRDGWLRTARGTRHWGDYSERGTPTSPARPRLSGRHVLSMTSVTPCGCSSASRDSRSPPSSR